VELHQTNEGWYLAFTDGRIQLIQIDFRVGLVINDDQNEATVFIGVPFLLRDHESDLVLTPEQPTSLAPILPYFNASVGSVVVVSNGQLRMEFRSGSILQVDPNDRYEAWQLGCPNCLLICKPGGGVAIFMEPDKA
jgi:hypothetical protein